MKTIILFIVSLAGYLIGSLSFARIVAHFVAPGEDIEKTEITLPDEDIVIESDAVSATVVRYHIGERFGCLVGVLDILKVALPAFLIKRWKPAEKYYLWYSTFATVGHNWPIYHRFQGGRGLSPITGGMLVMDWQGVLVGNTIGALSNFVTRNLFIASGLGMIIMIPWTWFRTRDRANLLYSVLMNIIFWGSLKPELENMVMLKRIGKYEEFEQAQEWMIKTAEGERAAEQIDMNDLVKKIKSRFRGNSR